MNETRRLGILEFARKLGDGKSGSFLLSLLFTLLMVYHCVFPLNAVWSVDGIVEPDCAQAMWNLWSVNEAITHGRNPYATNLIFYPLGVSNLSHQGIAPGFFPVTFLVKTLTGGSALYPLYTYRLLIWLCLTLLLYLSYRLLRELGFAWPAAAAAAIAFSFSDFFMEHIAHINILAAFFVPLSAFCLMRVYRKPESLSNAIAAAVALGSAVYFTETSLYIYLGALVFITLMSPFARERGMLIEKLRRAGWRRLTLTAAIFFLLIAPYVMLVWTDDSIKPAAAEHSLFSANLAGFFFPHPQRTPLYGEVFSSLVSGMNSGIGSYEVFTSFALIVFALIGVWTTRQRLLRIAAVTSLVFYVLSLGPSLKIFETDTGLPMPYAILMRFPPFDWGRTPSRFVMIGMFFLMIVAASGLSWFGNMVAQQRGRRASLVLLLLVLVWTVAEAYAPTPRQPEVIPPAKVANSVTGPVLNLPVYENDGYAMFLQLFHHEPIATGYLARSSPGRQQHMAQLKRLIDKGGAELCEGAAQMGLKTIIVAPEGYIARGKPELTPLTLRQCSLDIVDLRESRNELSDQADIAPATSSLHPRNFPLLVRGTQLYFNSPAAIPFLWYGWSGNEALSRWSDKGRAAVVFSINEVGDRLLQIKMSPFLAPGKLEAQRVRIEINGNLIQTLTLVEHDSKIYTVRIPVTVLRDKNLLVFEMPDADSPLSLSVSDDPRVLGINVQWLKLAVAEAELPNAPR